MNVGQAKAALSRYGFNNSDPLNSWLEAAKEEFLAAYDWPFLQVIVDPVSLAANTNTITLPTDFSKVQSLRYKGDPTTSISPGRKLKYEDAVGFERDVDNPDAPGMPYCYVTYAGAVRVYPVPTQLISLRLMYQKDLADINSLADAADMPGPIAIHYIVVIGAAYIGLQAESEEDRSSTAQAMFEAGISRTVRRLKSRIDESEQVVNVMGY